MVRSDLFGNQSISGERPNTTCFLFGVCEEKVLFGGNWKHSEKGKRDEIIPFYSY